MRTTRLWKTRAVAAAYALVAALVADTPPGMTYQLFSHYNGECLSGKYDREYAVVEACEVSRDGYPVPRQLWFLADNTIQNLGTTQCIAQSAQGGGLYTDMVSCKPWERVQQWERTPASDGRGTMFRHVDSGKYLAFIGGGEVFLLTDNPRDNGTRWDVKEFCPFGEPGLC